MHTLANTLTQTELFELVQRIDDNGHFVRTYRSAIIRTYSDRYRNAVLCATLDDNLWTVMVTESFAREFGLILAKDL